MKDLADEIKAADAEAGRRLCAAVLSMQLGYAGVDRLLKTELSGQPVSEWWIEEAKVLSRLAMQNRRDLVEEELDKPEEIAERTRLSARYLGELLRKYGAGLKLEPPQERDPLAHVAAALIRWLTELNKKSAAPFVFTMPGTGSVMQSGFLLCLATMPDFLVPQAAQAVQEALDSVLTPASEDEEQP